MTGYHPKAFTISPPRISEVISKRLSFALRIASGELHANALSTGLELKLQTLTQFIEILKFSFHNNDSLIEFIDNVCSGNVRKAIEYLAIFIGSGHINTENILRRDLENQNERRHYVVSLHEFIRAIIYREHFDFFPDDTDIVNLFEITQEGKEHFLAPIVLDYLLRHSHQGQDGFITTNTLIEFLQNEGFTVNQIEFTILRCVFRGLVETEARKSLNIGDPIPHSCRITTSGAYHLQKLVGMFVYIDAIIIDVPITVENYRSQIKDEISIYGRLHRGEIFCKYLNDVWTKCNFQYKGFNWPEISSSLTYDINNIRVRINKHNS